MTAAVLYQAFGDGCADHRCTSDPDVALIIHEVQKDMEWFILGQQRRLPDDRDPRPGGAGPSSLEPVEPRSVEDRRLA